MYQQNESTLGTCSGHLTLYPVPDFVLQPWEKFIKEPGRSSCMIHCHCDVTLIGCKDSNAMEYSACALLLARELGTPEDVILKQLGIQETELTSLQ